MGKKYLGKNLPELFKGPQTRQIPNPEKEEPCALDELWISWLEDELKGWTDIDQLEYFQSYVEQLLLRAREINEEPETITETLWTGCVQHELIKCGSKKCKCSNGKLHGPYWYHYPTDR